MTLRSKIAAALEDGEWHSVDELVAVLSKHIPPEVAVRFWRMDNPKSDITTDNLPGVIASGTRRKLKHQIAHMYTDGNVSVRLERRGPKTAYEYRIKPDGK